ncbi:SDHD, membrane anchor subunit of succinate dehydrogenase [Suillus placidus]|uniref:Succinate dehydrogenase [ubiquinone] cytochrome b small subunit n=1 Tax=Suillus placidus TaxID=48579 RepID=A0A9P7A4G0_9AGAM|nr:SDHD, membrane anchor subunit of succinate dehydrogenase [Suillus placidus]
MASSMILRSTLPRTFASAAGRSNSLRSALQVRAASSTTQYVPGGPILKGTVNDPTEFPHPSRMHGSYHWAFERFLAASLVPMTAAAFVTSGSSYPVLDGLLGLSLVMHSHIGFDSMIVDYVHKRKFSVLGPILTWTLRSATVGVLIGVYQFNTNDIGLTELIAKVWTA